MRQLPDDRRRDTPGPTAGAAVRTTDGAVVRVPGGTDGSAAADAILAAFARMIESADDPATAHPAPAAKAAAVV